MQESPDSFRREQSEVRNFGPDFYRECGEPMALEYLHRNVPSVAHVWWSEGDLGDKGKELDQKRGIDGFLELHSPSGDKLFLGIQISCADLQNPEVRERLHREFRNWMAHPIYEIDGEAEDLGAHKGDKIPTVFFHMNAADVNNAWENTSGKLGRAEEKRKVAEEASSAIPNNPKYLAGVLSSIMMSLDQIKKLRPDLAAILKQYQEVLAREERRILEPAAA